jgi:hypothetical protein
MPSIVSGRASVLAVITQEFRSFRGAETVKVVYLFRGSGLRTRCKRRSLEFSRSEPGFNPAVYRQ